MTSGDLHRVPTETEAALLARIAAAGPAGYSYASDAEWEMAVRLGASDRWLRDIYHTGECRLDGRPLWRGVLSDHGTAALARAREGGVIMPFSEHSMPPENEDEHYHDDLPPLSVVQRAADVQPDLQPQAAITPTAIPIEVVVTVPEVVSVCDIEGCGCTALVINGAKRKRCASHAYKTRARAVNAPAPEAVGAPTEAPPAVEPTGKPLGSEDKDKLATLTAALREARDAARWGAQQATEEISRLAEKIKELREEKTTAEDDLIRFSGVDHALTDILDDEPKQGALFDSAPTNARALQSLANETIAQGTDVTIRRGVQS